MEERIIPKSFWGSEIRYKWDRIMDLTLLPILKKCSKGYFRIAHSKALDLSKIEKILIVALNRGIGDAILYSPSLIVLRKAFPKANIVIVVNSYVKELVEKFHSLDKLMIYDRKRMKLREKIQFIQNLRHQRFDVVFDFIWYKHLESAILAFLSGSRVSVG
ncbi:hypothetical protein IIA15_03730, partial [candidate division TA06 bacterium]|nr:hypothetical protein [candidate division TA06 bacterium]